MEAYQDRRFPVDGMSCARCEERIRRKLGGLDGVRKVAADARAGEVRVVFDGQRLDLAQIHAAIAALGYRVGP